MDQPKQCNQAGNTLARKIPSGVERFVFAKAHPQIADFWIVQADLALAAAER